MLTLIDLLSGSDEIRLDALTTQPEPCPSMIRCSHSLLGFALLLMIGCGPSDTSKDKKEPLNAEQKIAADKMAAEISVLANPNRTNAEFLRHLRASVKMVQGFLMVDTPLKVELALLPPNSPWVIQCGAGMSVIFGSAVTGSSGDVSNEVEVRLALVPLTKERCQELAPLIGKEVQAILDGH